MEIDYVIATHQRSKATRGNENLSGVLVTKRFCAKNVLSIKRVRVVLTSPYLLSARYPSLLRRFTFATLKLGGGWVVPSYHVVVTTPFIRGLITVLHSVAQADVLFVRIAPFFTLLISGTREGC